MRNPPRPFAPVPLSVLSRRDLDSSDKITLAVLILRADEDGRWRGDLADLSTALGMSIRTVQRSLGHLRGAEYVKSRRIRWGTAYLLNRDAIQSVQNGGSIQPEDVLNQKPLTPDLSSDSGQNGTSLTPVLSGHSGQNGHDVFKNNQQPQEPEQEGAVVPINGKRKPVRPRVTACAHCGDTGVLDEDGSIRRCECPQGASVTEQFLEACRKHPPRPRARPADHAEGVGA